MGRNSGLLIKRARAFFLSCLTQVRHVWRTRQRETGYIINASNVHPCSMFVLKPLRNHGKLFRISHCMTSCAMVIRQREQLDTIRGREDVRGAL